MAWKNVTVPKPYPGEFRDDVAHVARNRESGVTIEQISKDIGVHSMTLQKWMSRVDIDEAALPGQTRIEAAELREARKQIRLLKQDNEALRRAAASSAAWCIRTEDRNSAPRKFLRALARHRMVGTMGRGTTARDNAAMESFFALLKKNVLDYRTCTTREQLRITTVTWIERTNHRRRGQATFGGLTTVEFETIINRTAFLRRD